MEAGRIKDQKKEPPVVGLLWTVHLVCCGLLLVFLIGGISIGAAVSYMQKSLAPLAVALLVTTIGWGGYHLTKRSKSK